MQEKDLNREKENHTQTAFIFDVDGVITDPKEKKVTEPKIIEDIKTQLQNGNVVAFNTGRSTEWVIEKVLPHILEDSEDDSILDNFLLVGEKGNTWAIYKDSAWQHFKDNSRSVPQYIADEARKIVAESPYDAIGGEHDPKESMYSWEMNDGSDIDEFQKQARPLASRFEELLKENELDDKFKVEPSVIAIDIESKESGKHLGAKRILDWMNEKNLDPQHFTTIGDSVSDIAMADELEDHQKRVNFVFVGGKTLNLVRSYPIQQTKKSFSEGTLEYLESLKEFSK